MLLFNKYKLHLAFLTFLIVLGVSFNIYRSQTIDKQTIETQMEGEVQDYVENANPVTEIILTAENEGQTALDLIKSSYNVSTEDYGQLGLFIKSINDLSGDDTHYWAFYVNDEYAVQSADKTILKKDDKIKFVYEEITNTNFSE